MLLNKAGCRNGGVPKQRHGRYGSDRKFFKTATFRCSYGQPAIPDIPPLRFIRHFFALVFSLLWAASAQAATFYVSPSGNDSNPGTLVSPWRTIQKAANTAAPGDTTLVAGGTYSEKVSFTRSGTASQKITFMNVSGQTPMIDGTGVTVPKWGSLVNLSNAGYIRLEGFEIRNSGYYGLNIAGESHHLELVNLDVHDSIHSGIMVDGPRTRPAFSIIRNNRIHNNGAGGITLYYATGGYYRIENNEVYSNRGESNYDGVQIGGGDAGSHHVVVKNNKTHDNGLANVGEDNLDLGGHDLNHHYLVEGNDVYGAIGSFKLHSGSGKAGTYIAGTSSFHIARFNKITGIGHVTYGFPNPIAVYNNTFVDCNQCVMFWGEDSSANQTMGDSTYTGGDAGRMTWKNNIFWQEKPTTYSKLLTAGPAGSSIDVSYKSVRFQNSLYKFASGQNIGWNPTTFGPNINSAIFAQFQASHSPDNPDTGSLLTTAANTAMFANYAGRDYHLVSGSPAIDKGIPLTKATNSGSNSTTLTVDRASYFQDGYCTGGECLNTPDSIKIGNNAPVQIAAGGLVDNTNTITLSAPMSWTVGDPVTLPYNGATPDIGAFESGGTAPPSSSACDINTDGSANVSDVQLVVNQAIGAASCTGDINQDGLCNVVDVQRVVNAALGGICVTQ